MIPDHHFTEADYLAEKAEIAAQTAPLPEATDAELEALADYTGDPLLDGPDLDRYWRDDTDQRHTEAVIPW